MRNKLRMAIRGLALITMSVAVQAAVDGTTGTPLGGIGAGGVRFCGHQGNFYSTEQCPLAWKNFSPISNSCFQVYTNRGGSVQTNGKLKAVQNNGRADDDAIYPLHTANLGTTNNVVVTLTAFSPISFDSVDLMCYPYAFFEITLTNTASTEVDAAVAMQISTANNPVWVAGKGIKSSGGVERALYATSSSAGVAISAGSDNGFMTSGQCDNAISGKTNKVAVKIKLAAQASGTVKFVYAWYYGPDPSRYYYTNAFSNAGNIADAGLAQFDRFKANATQIVTRMRASNIPDWIRDHTLNSLCNLTTNSIYTKDGRHCYTEGQWGINGTMDQMWHTRFLTTMIVPDLAWQELRWWARTQKTNPVGQIHHDMGGSMEKLWGWDDQQHSEYGWQPNCDRWVDLNAAFIISVYEAFIATNNKTQLDWFWPYVKKAGQRLLDQVKQYGNKQYPYTFDSTQNSYDIDGIDADIYSASITTPTYKIMTIFAETYNDNTLKKTYQNAFDTVKISFKKRYLTNNFPTGKRAESQLAGQWLSFFLRFGHIYSQEDLDYGLNLLDKYYQTTTKGLGSPNGSYFDEWSPYFVAHFGGLCLQTGHFDWWKGLQHDWYERNYLNRNLVFNQQLGVPPKVSSPMYLADSTSVYNQYISIPVLWRNYYTLLGYHRNKVTGELWIEPVIPPEMNHSLKDGFFFSPEGNGTISATESGTSFQNQTIVFKSDKPMTVSTLYLSDKSTDSVAVTVNDVRKTLSRIGTGYAKELKVDFSETIDSMGKTIKVMYGKDIVTGVHRNRLAGTTKSGAFTIQGASIFFSAELSGVQKRVALFDLTGRVIRILVTEGRYIDLRKEANIPRGAYIVRFAGETKKVMAQ